MNELAQWAAIAVLAAMILRQRAGTVHENLLAVLLLAGKAIDQLIQWLGGTRK